MLPPFSRNDKSYVPSKGRFLMTRSWDLIWTVAIIFLINRYPLYLYQQDFTLVSDGFLHRLPSVTPTEWAIRIYLTLIGKGEPYLALRAGHSLVSIVAVIGGDLPERYPPLFGSIKEAYRVRRFYVSFWHHLIRKAFTSHSSFVVNDVLRVPRRTETSRYMVLAFTFLMSAGMHVFVAPNVPLRCSAWPQLRYYFSIAGAIILEDTVTFAYRRFTRKSVAAQLKQDSESTKAETVEAEVTSLDKPPNDLKRRNGMISRTEVEAKTPTTTAPEARNKTSSTLFRALGYVWVAAFEVWSTSKFLYLTQQCLAR
ncbi:hypothetical protein MMC18_006538 [Xylographa bjoerkii]|nr:hypothetical protein [Xylographa bjoerkii]